MARASPSASGLMTNSTPSAPRTTPTTPLVGATPYAGPTPTPGTGASPDLGGAGRMAVLIAVACIGALCVMVAVIALGVITWLAKLTRSYGSNNMSLV